MLAGATGLEDGDDVRMPQPRRGASFAEKSFRQRRIVGSQTRHFQGDFAVQLRIVGTIDAAESALAEQGAHLKAADLRVTVALLTGCKRPRRRWIVALGIRVARVGRHGRL